MLRTHCALQSIDDDTQVALRVLPMARRKQRIGPYRERIGK